MDGPGVEAFAAASKYLVEVVRAVPESEWSRPGLGEWSVLELIGHANRAHETIVDYLNDPQPQEPPGSSYFSDESIAQRGRESVARLGTDPASAVAAKSDAVLEVVARTAADTILGSPVRTMTLAQYLPSRTAELVIHALDLARALELDLDPPNNALAASLHFVTGISVRKNSGTDVLMALTGRSELPAHFSVY